MRMLYAVNENIREFAKPVVCVFQPFAMCAYVANKNIHQFALCVNTQ